MTAKITVRVHSGSRPRRFCPVSVAPGKTATVWELVRADRERLVASQLGRDDGVDRVWWVIENQPANTTAVYELRPRTGRRRPRARVVARPGPTGWRLGTARERMVEFLCPDHGAPTLTFLAGNRIAATLLIEPGSPVPGRIRSNEPEIEQGPVFAALKTTYRYFEDAKPKWVESYVVRCFGSDDSCRMTDVSLRWHADACPISLSAVASPASLVPTMRVTLTDVVADKIVAPPGWVGPEEVVNRSAPFLLALGPDLAVAVLVVSTGFGFPPKWTATGNSLVCIIPTLASGRDALSGCRVALGESIAMTLRVLVFAAHDPVRYCTDRYFDLDCPPHVEL